MNPMKHAPNTILKISNSPGLLVSVRSAAEAITALEAGADVIDVKEPSRGALGAADCETIAAVVRAVAGRAPLRLHLENSLTSASTIVMAMRRPSQPAYRCSSSDWPVAPISLIGSPSGEMQSPRSAAVNRTVARSRSPLCTPIGEPLPRRRQTGFSTPPFRLAPLCCWSTRSTKPPATYSTTGPLTTCDSLFVAFARRTSPSYSPVRSRATPSQPPSAWVPISSPSAGAACNAGREGTVSADRVASLKSAISQLQQVSERTTSVVTSRTR